MSDFHDNFLITSVNKSEKGRLFCQNEKIATKYHSIVTTRIEIGKNVLQEQLYLKVCIIVSKKYMHVGNLC